MALLLSALAEAPSLEISIRKQKVTLRAIPSRHLLILEGAFSKPTPPLIKDPTKGSGDGVAPIPNYNDAGYLRSFDLWAEKRNAAVLAALADMTIDGAGTYSELAAAYAVDRKQDALVNFATKAAEQVPLKLSENEVEGLLAKFSKATSLDALVEAEAKNSLRRGDSPPMPEAAGNSPTTTTAAAPTP